tara:strand:+ start:414 stop:599 length:186 start_codon:yes stop_codon:yes gene_type:complete
MGKKYTITLEAEDDQEITIKPLGTTMTRRVSADDSDKGTTTAMTTNSPRSGDVGADTDADM